MSNNNPIICICGPTASGKSELAEQISLHVHGEVVSIDAMQVYFGMNIGTAKTPPNERKVPLHMVDVCDVTHDYSVQLFQRDARKCIDTLLEQDKVPVLCGGTGLYLNAVIDVMEFPHGEKNSKARSSYEMYLDTNGAQALYQLLMQRDSASALLIHPNNTRRIIRALELCDEGESYAEQNKGLHKRAAFYNALIFGITWNRETLYERINQRVDDMFKQGLEDEVHALLANGLTRKSTAGQAIGYKELLDYFDGEISLEEAKEAIKKRSRNYAKRQISWFKNDARVQWFNLETSSIQEACTEIINAYKAACDDA